MILTKNKIKHCFLTFKHFTCAARLAQIYTCLDSAELEQFAYQIKPKAIFLQFFDGDESLKRISEKPNVNFNDILITAAIESSSINSIFYHIKLARENAILVKEILTEESWLALNKLYLWLKSISTENISVLDKNYFYQSIITSFHTFIGDYYLSQYRNHAFECMMLGIRVESAIQVVSILSHCLELWLSSKKQVSMNEADEEKYCQFILRMCSGVESYFLTNQPINLENVIKFLLKNNHFSFSFISSLSKSAEVLLYLDKMKNLENPYILKSIFDVLDTLDDNIVTADEGMTKLLGRFYIDCVNLNDMILANFSRNNVSLASEFNRSIEPNIGQIYLIPLKSTTRITLPKNLYIPSLTNDHAPSIYTVNHESLYRYDGEVLKSKHLLRLQPSHDQLQTLLHYRLSMYLDGKLASVQHYNFMGAFGNNATFCEIKEPYTELRIVSESFLSVCDNPTITDEFLHQRSIIPLVWMPWDRIMMQAFLIPPELPESQLYELSEYAMSFVKRNNGEVYSVLNDINNTIYQQYAYIPGSTVLSTTPYEVYVNRKGVCQDFANLFICLARLLNVPARYRVGYIYTGVDYENKIQSEASHAWVEVYLPLKGWVGFDPTNGCLAGKNHIKVACGRNYRDATPTSGTIYQGGGNETLSTSVQVKEVENLEEELRKSILDSL